jgi:hypothetical protein
VITALRMAVSVIAFQVIAADGERVGGPAFFAAADGVTSDAASAASAVTSTRCLFIELPPLRLIPSAETAFPPGSAAIVGCDQAGVHSSFVVSFEVL